MKKRYDWSKPVTTEKIRLEIKVAFDAKHKYKLSTAAALWHRMDKRQLCHSKRWVRMYKGRAQGPGDGPLEFYAICITPENDSEISAVYIVDDPIQEFHRLNTAEAILLE